jgi:hypothetical protein
MAPRSSGSSTVDGDSPAIDVDVEVDALYLDDPDGFTAARDALAKRLRAAGRKDEAAAVKGLRRPTVAAWAVNRVARDRADDLGRLRDIGAELRRVQAQALRRRDGDGDDTADRLRDLGSRRRALVAELADAAATVIGSRNGVAPDAHRADIVGTFEAVAADDEGADEVRTGRLARPRAAPVGFGTPAGEDAEILVLDDDGPRRSSSKARGAGGGAPTGGTSGSSGSGSDTRGRGRKGNGTKTTEGARGGAVHVLDAAEAAEHEVTRLESALTVARQELARAKEAAARAEVAAGAADATAKRSQSSS